MLLNRLNFEFALLDLLWFPSPEAPNDQANNEESRWGQKQHADRNIPTTIVDGLQDRNAKQSAQPKQLA